jgi:formate dehydrogenase major subunit
MEQDAAERAVGSNGANGGNGTRSWAQFFKRHAGYAPSPMSKRTDELHARIRDADVTVSVCPYCGVGCSQLVYHKDGRIIDIEGNPESPISAGHLCPKGADTYQLINNPNRPTKVLYRAPRSDHWEERPLDWAMDRIAELTKKTRDDTFQERSPDGKTLMNTTAIFSLGGATIDNEWNYTHAKLMRSLGIVAIENQARI